MTQKFNFQGGSLPPSNACVPNSQPIQGTFYPAQKGRTRFSFNFKLPKSLPTSTNFGKLGSIKYDLRVYASSILNGNVDVKREELTIQVVERWQDWIGEKLDWMKGVERKGSEKLTGGGEGKFELVAAVGKGEGVEDPRRLFWRGEPAMDWVGKGRVTVKVKVRNATTKHVSHLIRLHVLLLNFKYHLDRSLD